MWFIWWIFYEIRLVPWNATTRLSTALFAIMALCFFASVFYFLPRYAVWHRSWVKNAEAGAWSIWTTSLTALLFAVGLFGILIYVRDIGAGLRSITGFFDALLQQSALIRVQSQLSGSIGTQLTYFGWIAVMLAVYGIASKKLSRAWWIPVSLVFIGNCLYIDRTRPTWILFIGAMMLLPAARRLSLAKLATYGFSALALIFVLFGVIGEWIGKKPNPSLYGTTVLPSYAVNQYVYGTSAFAYFNDLILQNEQGSGGLDGNFYPALQALSFVGIAPAPSEQVLPFSNVPFPANTGTALQPFWQDGGLLGVFLGILVLSFGMDVLGLLMLRAGTPLALCGWANLCFVSMIAFFTPKLNNTPTWVIGAFSIGSFVVHTLRSSSARTAQPWVPKVK